MKPFLVDDVAITDLLLREAEVPHLVLQYHLAINWRFDLLFGVLVLPAFFPVEECPNQLRLRLLDELLIRCLGSKVLRRLHVIIPALVLGGRHFELLVDLDQALSALFLLWVITVTIGLVSAAVTLMRAPNVVLELAQGENLIPRDVLVGSSASASLSLEQIFAMVRGTVHCVQDLEVDPVGEIEAALIFLVRLLLYFWDVVRVVDFRERLIIKLLLGSYEHI